MSDLVNLVAKESEQWNKHIIWIKVNVGFILAEAELIQQAGNNVDDIMQVADAFYSYYSIFTDNEIALYKSARIIESEPSKAMHELYKFPIQNMKGCFIPWLMGLNTVIKKHQEGEHNLATLLMLTCGGEILNSHNEFHNNMECLELKLEEYTNKINRCTNRDGRNNEVDKIINGDFGCPICRTIAGKKYNYADIPFDRVDEILDTNRYSLWITVCKYCHQLYLEKFTESNWVHGPEAMCSTWVPITSSEVTTLNEIVETGRRDLYNIEKSTVKMFTGRKVLMLDDEQNFYWN